MTGKDNSTQVLVKFLKQLKINITAQSISEDLEKHPDYSTLLAFSDVLDSFNISNSAYKVSHDKLSEVPVPFITHMMNGSFAMVSQVGDKAVTVSNDRWDNKKMPKADFLKLYGQTVLVAELSEKAEDTVYIEKHRAEKLKNLRVPFTLTVLALIISSALVLHPSYIASFTLPTVLLTLFKTVGLTVSILLLIQSMDANNPLVQKLCGHDNDKNCNSILSSTAAKIGWISWSEIGFFYFAGTLTALLINPANKGFISILFMVNIAALPYTLYSVYYQWRLAEQWCIFCCIVQGTLWLEFISLLSTLNSKLYTPALSDAAGFAIIMMLPVVLWIFIKPYLLQLTKVAPLSAQLRKFKYNKDIFDAILKDQPKYAMPDDSWSIVMGNVEANNIVTMVSNPFCSPCAKAHTQIEEALKNLDNIQVRVVFAGDSTNEKDPRKRVHRHLMALNELPDKTIVRRALHHWYTQNQKNYDTWAESYPIAVTTANNHKLDNQKAWVEMAGITGTPTLLLNGYRLPAVYQLQDLKYMLD